MARNPTDYAIVIGINGYSQLRRLGGAEADAAKVVEWLQRDEGGGLLTANIRLITSPPTLPDDPFEARPIKTQIDRALSDFGAELNERIGRRLYFYFSGHGFGSAFDDVGMLMANAAPLRLGSNIGLRAYLKYFHETGLFDEVIFILDCCRDPARTAETAGPDFTPPPLDPLPRVQDFVVLAAAYGEKAFEPTNSATGEPRGVLTQALLEGLEQAAAADNKGRVTAFSLREYVRLRVPQLATDEKLRQQPDVARLPNDDLVFCTLATAKLHLRIAAPAGIGGELVLRDGNDLSEIARCPSDQATAAHPWDIELPRNSRYEIEHTVSALGVVVDLRKATGDPYVYRFPRP